MLAPGLLPLNELVDIDILHCSYNHLNEAWLRATAKEMDVMLKGELEKCKGYSLSKGLRKGIQRTTVTRAVKNLERVFIDLGGPKPVQVANYGGMH